MSHSSSPCGLPAGLAIRRARAADAGPLAALGAALFAQAYGPTHPEPELGAYLDRAFRPEQVARDMAEDGAVFLLVEEASAGPVGYAQVQPGATLSVAPWATSPGCEVKRFYLDQAWQGRGVARALMEECLDAATESGAEVLWLQVWQEADWAIRFYQRAGFHIVGETPFPWGSRMETDWLMARDVPTP